MVTVVSLEGSLYLKDPQSVIAYTLRRYSRTPKNTIPILPDLIISLPYQIAKFGREPDNLVQNIEGDLQRVFSRIFGNERQITVNVSYTKRDTISYDTTISIVYTTLSGELQQTGTTITLVNGRLMIPEDQISWETNPFAPV